MKNTITLIYNLSHHYIGIKEQEINSKFDLLSLESMNELWKVEDVKEKNSI